jgi:tryptophanyl-tRNA synthetase
MGKSRRNAIPIRASADETARLVAAAKTDAERVITYEPARRPEVSSLVLLAALCRDAAPAQVAAEIGAGGAAALKRAVTDAINQRFAEIRSRRAELARDPGYLRAVLAAGAERVAAITAATMADVRALMHTSY